MRENEIAKEVRRLFRKGMAFTFEQYNNRSKLGVTVEEVERTVEMQLVDKLAAPFDSMYIWR